MNGYNTPKEIYDELRKSVIGQDEAMRAVSLIVWNAFCGRRSTALLVGKTGTGKTETFRALEKMFPNRVLTVDSTKLSPEGWSQSSMHISDIFRSHPDFGVDQSILILDEVDKKMKPACGAKNTDYHALVQDDMLKLCDGDVLEISTGNQKYPSIRVDGRNITVILAGAFSELQSGKQSVSIPLGFISAPVSEDSVRHEITIDDIIGYGMKSELAGRIDRIIQMRDIGEDEMFQIAIKTKNRMEYEYSCPLQLSDTDLRRISEKAFEAGFGARGIRKELLKIIDNTQFEHPEIYEMQEAGVPEDLPFD